MWAERVCADTVSGHNICRPTLVAKEDICMAGLEC